MDYQIWLDLPYEGPGLFSVIDIDELACFKIYLLSPRKQGAFFRWKRKAKEFSICMIENSTQPSSLEAGMTGY